MNTTQAGDNKLAVATAGKMATTGRMTRTGKLRGYPWLGLVVSAIVGLALTVGLTDSAEAATITEFAIPTAVSGPEGITAGPDGALWFTELNTNKIGRITTAGAITEFMIPTPSSGPGGITAGPDGALWFTEFNPNPQNGASQIGRITTAGTITEFVAFPAPSFTIPIGPTTITAGPDGALWFGGVNVPQIWRITTTGTTTGFGIPTPDGFAEGITVGPDGALWFTERNTNKIGRITTAGAITEFPIPTAGSGPIGITAGPDGALWFTELFGNRIGRITTTGVITEFTLPAGGGSEGIIAGPDGALWFTEHGANKIGRITTTGSITEFAIPTAGSEPEGITVGPDGALWFTEHGANKIGRIMPDLEASVSVSSGQLGDALIFPLFDVNNLNTLIAIESVTDRTTVHRVRFREEISGASVLSFDLCLTPFSTWTAAVFRDGSVTKVQSTSTLLVNGSATPLDTILSPDATRGFIEVVGLRGTTTASSDTAICTDSTVGGDAFNSTMGTTYFVNPAQSPILAYGMNALALKDFAAAKISDGTVLGNNAVANALVLQGTQTGGLESGDFGSRYFVDPAFGAETQIVMTFATGPTTGGCADCKVPSSMTVAPFTEGGTVLPSFARATSSHLVNIFTLTSSDIASPSGVFDLFDTSLAVNIPVTGFIVQTTSTPPPGSPFFNVLFPLTIK